MSDWCCDAVTESDVDPEFPHIFFRERLEGEGRGLLVEGYEGRQVGQCHRHFLGFSVRDSGQRVGRLRTQEQIERALQSRLKEGWLVKDLYFEAKRFSF